MGGVKTIDMSTWHTETMTKAMCSHKTKTQADGSKTESLAAQLIRRLISCVFTQNMTNMKASSQWKTQAACHTKQEKNRESKTKTTNAHGQRSARPKRTRDRMLPQQDQTWSVSVRTPTWNQTWAWNKTRVPGSEHHAPTWNRACRQESSQENKTRRECQGSVTKTWIN